jgi:probable rRNA maturation factor
MSLEIQIEIGPGIEPPLAPEVLERAVAIVLRREAVPRAEIAVVLVDDEEIARLNFDYLGHDGPTDVISFPLQLDGDPPLGDIYVCVDQARRQADELGVPLAEELLRLTVHGTLHVLGHDHPDGPERIDSPMFERQEALVREILADLADAG